MQLQGSCHCKRVNFQVESEHPYPFNLCYCSICRKTAGGGGLRLISGELHKVVRQGNRLFQSIGL